jgi:hypothetical protein
MGVMPDSLSTLSARISRIPFPVRVVQVVVVLTLVGRFFGKTWFGAIATAVMIALISLMAVVPALLWRRSHPRAEQERASTRAGSLHRSRLLQSAQRRDPVITAARQEAAAPSSTLWSAPMPGRSLDRRAGCILGAWRVERWLGWGSLPRASAPSRLASR